MICSQNINDHLLLHYSFDGNFNGESVHVNNGNNHGATFTEDRFVNPHSACYIKGIDNYIEFPNIRELKPDLPVSMAFWIKYGSDSYMDRPFWELRLKKIEMLVSIVYIVVTR